MEGNWSKSSDKPSSRGATSNENQPISKTEWGATNETETDSSNETADAIAHHLDSDAYDPRIRSRQLLTDDSSKDYSTTSYVPEISEYWKQVVAALLLGPTFFMIMIAGAILYVQFPHTVTYYLFVIFSLTFLAARLSLPIALYRDITQVRESMVEWKPRKWPYVIGTLIVPPPLEFFATILYLSNRYQIIGTPDYKDVLPWLKSKWQQYSQETGNAA